MSDREDEGPEAELEPDFDHDDFDLEEEDIDTKRQEEEAELSDEEEHYTLTRKPIKKVEKVRKPPLRPNSYSVYTLSRALRARADEIARGSPIYTTFDPTRVISPMEIALKEAKEGRLPYDEVISRPDGQTDLIPLWAKTTRPPK